MINGLKQIASYYLFSDYPWNSDGMILQALFIKLSGGISALFLKINYLISGDIKKCYKYEYIETNISIHDNTKMSILLICIIQYRKKL